MADPSARRIDKPWGFEEIWAHTDRYVGKLLVIEPGCRLSLQYHRKKDESIRVLRGVLYLQIEQDDGAMIAEELRPGEHRRIAPGRRHRFEARQNRVELIEVSSPELDDVVRLEDDFDRVREDP